MRRVLRAAAVTAALLSLAAACGLDDTEIIEGALPGDGDASADATTFDASRDSATDGSTDGTIGDSTISDTGVDTGADTGADASDSGSATDAESDAADASDADAEVDAGADAGFDAGPCPTLTICDGNPSACGGSQVCVPDVPAGWTLLGFDDSAHLTGTPCGTDYAGASTTQIQDGGAAASCECDCDAGATPSCSNTQVVITTGAACDQNPTTVAASSCSPLGSTYAAGDFYEPSLQADPTTCTPNLITTKSSWSAGSARDCDFTGGSTELCAAHSTCVAASGATHTACVKQAYSGAIPPDCASACPSSFNSSCWAVSSSIADNRACTGCGCGWSDPGCTSAVVTAHTSAACSDPGTALTLAACQNEDISSATALSVTGTDSAPTCGITTGASASGGVTFGTEELVCCAN